MTTPRIYVYKITFEEVRHYYYGVHKEKKFGEYYMGSPYTHKWMWDFYTPQIQILQFFEFSDEGYKQARQIEDRLIKPVFNTDPFCLNEHWGGIPSLDACRRGGKKSSQLQKENGTGFSAMSFEQRSQTAKKNHENGVGCFSLTKEELRENGRIVGQKCKENGTGIFKLTPEQRSENGRKTYELGIGVHAMSSSEKSEAGKKGGRTTYERGVGLFKIPPEQKSECSRRVGKAVCSQKWQCTKTGFVANPGNLSQYQRARGIDTSNRIRIE
jgi:general stress protein YciG